MSNIFFNFKQFTVYQNLCAMKVGTDGVLLGALADGGGRILDIGTGTGLVALMMAQRFPLSQITGMDIDDGAVIQAKRNVELSPFSNRVNVVQADFNTYNTEIKYDSITCNPPYFENGALCPDEQRCVARHASSLPFSTLVSKAAQLLTVNGTMSIIIPTDCLGRIEEECAYASMFIAKRLFICTSERKEPKRVILKISKSQPTEAFVCTQCLMQDGKKSEWYNQISREFYL